MLEAVKARRDHVLDSVRLVLTLEIRDDAYPESLKLYLRQVIEQALALLQNPNLVEGTTRSEAIALALRLSGDEELVKALSRVARDDATSTVDAQYALAGLEPIVDAVSQPSHFGTAVYAAI